MAQHYTAAGCSEQAVPYWQRAGQHPATARPIWKPSATTTGIELLTTLPKTPEHTQQAVSLHIALGASMLMTRGMQRPK